MEQDATRHPPGRTIETDVCVIGAGPAGLVVGATLAAKGRDVVVLESGGATSDVPVQDLSDGDTTGDAIERLGASRHRQVGGNSCLWNTPTLGGPGAKYVPLDPWDLSPRWPEALHGWPVEYQELLRCYERAQRLAMLGPFAYEASSWAGSGRTAIPPGAGITSRVYQFGARDALLQPLLATLRRATNARLMTRATVVQLATSASRATVTVATPGGDRWQVQARRVVLATGAVENARLLLVAVHARGGVHDRSGWLGCGFMEHPRDRAMTLRPTTRDAYRVLAFYDRHEAADGTTIAGRLALDGEQPGHTLNASATLLPLIGVRRARLRAALGPVGRSPALRRWMPPEGHGWSLHPAPTRVFQGFTVLLNLEQPPHRENRVQLSSRRDLYGVPLPALHWQWDAADHARLVALRKRVAHALEDVGVGRVIVGGDPRPDPNARHHAGTTRMHADPRYGVVDADGRVHGTDTLFVAGASTFPTAGFANPTLTIVAMAVRLADRLAAEP